MKKITQKELTKIIADHQHFLLKDVANWKSKQANFENKVLENLEITNVNLADANFSESFVKDCRFTDVNLTSSHFYQANISQSFFIGTRNLRNSSMLLNYCQFQKATLNQVEFNNINIIESNFNWSEGSNLVFQKANLNSSVFKEATFESTTFSDSFLDECDFLKADLKGITLKNVSLSNALFRSSNLEKSKFKSTFGMPYLNDSNFKDASFIDGIPLWRGALKAKLDSKQIKNLVYYVVSIGLNSPNVSKEDKKVLQNLVDFANQSDLVKKKIYKPLKK